MNIGEKAFEELYPRRESKIVTLSYSKAFKPYNGNIKYTDKKIDFSFSHLWKTVSEEIQIGLAQHLLQKAYKTKKRTTNIDLYEKFLEKVAKYAELGDKKTDVELEYSFMRVNQKYFHDFMDSPNLEWGSDSTTQLGTYTYHTDTVRISKIFHNLDEEDQWILDYIMYHELLHKKFGLKHENGSCRHHPPEFKALERKFHVENAEKRLNSFVRKAKKYSQVEESGPLLKIMRNLFK